jgi:hypothetical protein
MRCWHASNCLRPASLTRARFPWPALGNLREEPSAGRPHARIRGGESRMAELPDRHRSLDACSLFGGTERHMADTYHQLARVVREPNSLFGGP